MTIDIGSVPWHPPPPEGRKRAIHVTNIRGGFMGPILDVDLSTGAISNYEISDDDRRHYLGGKILASLVLEAHDEWSECGLVRDSADQFPREPMRYFGGAMVMAAKRRIETLDDRGQKAGPLTRAISGLAPAGLTPVKGHHTETKP